MILRLVEILALPAMIWAAQITLIVAAVLVVSIPVVIAFRGRFP